MKTKSMNAAKLSAQTELLGEDFLHKILSDLKARGASDAIVSASQSRSCGISVRQRLFEDVTHEEECSLTIKTFAGKRSAQVSTNAPSPAVIATLVDRVTRMAELASEDPHAGLPEANLLAAITDEASLERADPTEPDLVRFETGALELEDHALAVAGISASQGASIGWKIANSHTIATNGLSRLSKGTRFHASVSVIAAQSDSREVAGFHHMARWQEDLLPLDGIGKRAGDYAAEKLGSRKVASCRAPVILDQRTSFAVIRAFLGAISGRNIYNKETFLSDPLGSQVFASGFTLTEDPFRRRGLASRLVDEDGIAPFEGAIVSNGVVQTLLIDHYEGKRLGLASTGHAGGVSNLTVAPGHLDRSQLMREADTGLVVTGIMGASVNSHTGDFSMGVTGHWFEAGAIAHAVSEVTIAGNLKDVFADLVVGSDLEYLGQANAPSLLLQPLAIGGA